MAHRWRLGFALFVLLPVIPAGAAAGPVNANRPLLLYTAIDLDEVATVETMRADGSGARRLAIGSAPAWSPDGARIAYRAGDGVFVMSADGTAKVRVARATATEDPPAWSPDGRRLAFTVGSVDGVSAPTLVVAEARTASGVRSIEKGSDPAWSPDGSLLAYVRNGGDPAERALVVQGVDGTTATLVVATTGTIEAPAWSPDSRHIAYVLRPGNPNDLPTLWIVSSAGGEPRRLGDIGAESPRWSLNGSTILFTRGGVSNCNYKGGCDLEGYPCGGDACGQLAGLYSIRADGSGQRRLTTGLDSSPEWSGDGDRISFVRYADDTTLETVHAIYVARPDGGCQTALAIESETRRFDRRASWQPGTRARLGALHCSDSAVTGTITGSALLGGKVRLAFALRNLGDRPARRVRFGLEVSRFYTLAPRRGCSDRIVRRGTVRRRVLECPLGTIAAGRTKRLELHGLLDPKAEALFPSYLERSTRDIWARASVRAAADVNPSNDVLELVHTVVPCTLEGTSAGNRLEGGPRRDLICAREGDDAVRARGGDDVVDGGVGADFIDPGRGRDVVVGRGGDDVIAAADGERDLVFCGNGTDRVVADPIDDVNPSCETVVRR